MSASTATTIARRELLSYFVSPIAYVAMCLFLVATGALFAWKDFEPGQTATMRFLMEWMVWILVVIIPVLCMGLLAQEWAGGTIESLMTAPVDDADVVLGKFLGSLGFFLVLLAPTVVYMAMLRVYAHPDFGPILCGYLGIILVGALFISVGLFCSSLTKSQVVAAVAAMAILFVVTIIPYLASAVATLPTFWRKLADQGVFARYTDFAKGVLDTRNLVYFVVLTGVFLFLTVKVLESRRWK